MFDDKTKLGVASCLAGAAAAVASMALIGKFGSSSEPKNGSSASATEESKMPNELVAVIGDVGGTNVRLTLRKLCLRTRTSTEIKPLTKFASQDMKNFSEAMGLFLQVSQQQTL